jgi:hypothetical protein
MQVAVNRKDLKFFPDSSRVIARFLFTGDKRALATIRSVLNMSEKDASTALTQVLRDFSMRHRNISKVFENNFNKIAHLFAQLEIEQENLDFPRKLLIGSYFTME